MNQGATLHRQTGSKQAVERAGSEAEMAAKCPDMQEKLACAGTGIRALSFPALNGGACRASWSSLARAEPASTSHPGGDTWLRRQVILQRWFERKSLLAESAWLDLSMQGRRRTRPSAPSSDSQVLDFGGTGRIRTVEYGFCRPGPYHLATVPWLHAPLPL